MNTLHIVSSSGVYGIETMILQLLRELRNQGETVSLLCLDGESSGFTVEARRRGLPVASVECSKAIAPLGWIALCWYLARHRPTRVHLHGYKAIILAGFISILLRQRFIVTYHGLASTAIALSPSLKKYLMTETLVLPRASAVIAVSDEIRTELIERGVPKGRTFLIPNGIADSYSAARSGSSTVIEHSRLVAVGRLVPEKNFALLIQAMPLLCAAFPNVTLDIAGEGPLREEILEGARKLGVLDRVRFLGYVSDIPSLLASADCFVMPSKTEGMPMALIEAMAASKAIVASSVGGIPSMVRHRKEALLFPSGDLEALVTEISKFLGDAAERRRFGDAARIRYVEQFTASAMANAYRNLYDAQSVRARA